MRHGRRYVRTFGGLFLTASVVGVAACAADMPVTAGAVRRGLEEDLRIEAGPGESTPIRWIGVAPGGSMTLAREQHGTLEHFDDAGGLTATWTLEGVGGEDFGGPVRGGWLGDTLWVADELERIALLGLDGAVARTLPRIQSASPRPADAERLPVFHFVFPYALYPGDTLLAVAQGAAGDPLADAIRGTALVRMTSSGVVDRVVLETPPNDGALTVRIGQGSAVVHVPFYPRPFWAVAPDGSRIATVTTDVHGPEGGTYSVAAYTATGEQIFRREVPFEGVELPAAVADSALRSRLAALPEADDALVGAVRSRMPPVYPPIEDIVVGTDGSVWIGLRSTPTGGPYLGLDAAGEQQGEVLLPPGVRLGAATSTHLYGLERDASGAHRILRYRILEQQVASR